MRHVDTSAGGPSIRPPLAMTGWKQHRRRPPNAVSDTIEHDPATVRAPDVRPTIEELLARIAREGGDRAETIQAFARALTRRLSDEDLAEIDPDGLYGLVTSAFAFADGRRRESSAVRVFTPDRGSNGYRAPGSVIEATTDDSPFLVDSVSEELTSRGLTIVRLLHPVLGTERAEDGRLVRVLSGREAERRESFMHFE